MFEIPLAISTISKQFSLWFYSFNYTFTDFQVNWGEIVSRYGILILKF